MTQARGTILIVEDEPEIRRFLKASLDAEGYATVEAANARRGCIDASMHKPDMALVDLGLPGGDGLDVIRAIRSWSPMPILVLSARTHERSKIEALDAGADDYMTKPFGVGELLARVRAGLRHASRAANGDTLLQLGDARVDFTARRTVRGNQDVHLTATAYRLLAVLARQAGRVVTHRQLLTEVWGPSHADDTHYLRIYMKQLRDKLEPDPMQPRYLRTELGVGYRLESDDAASAAS